MHVCVYVYVVIPFSLAQTCTQEFCYSIREIEHMKKCLQDVKSVQGASSSMRRKVLECGARQ